MSALAAKLGVCVVIGDGLRTMLAVRPSCCPRSTWFPPAFVIGFGSPAAAQAFIPAAGDGTVSVSYQAVVARGQHSVLGESLEARTDDLTEAHDLIWYVEYGLSDRIAVHASLPYIAVRYEGPLPHLIGVKGQPSDLDDGTYHGSFQDFYFGTRLKLVESPRLALTPFVEAIVPSHHYESGG